MAVAPGAKLRDIVGPDHARASDGIAFAVDGLTPRMAVSPGSYQEVAEVLRHADANQLAVIPFGGGTAMDLGNAPSKYDMALDMSRLNAIVEYEPADLTVTCQAGMTLTALQDHLTEAGQTLPLGPFADPRATIGGILASNRTGAYVHSYGRPRDATIGMRVATPDGRIARAGGRVVKNVAGYDLCKLYTGSLGTLGVVVEATFKVAPLATAQASCAFRMPLVEGACELAAEVESAGLSVRAIEIVVEGSDECGVTVDVAGSPPAVERSVAEVRALVSPVGAAPSEQPAPFPASLSGSTLVCRFGVLPTHVPELVEALRKLDPQPKIVAWPMGLVFAAWDEPGDETRRLSEARAIVREGTMVVERCGAETKRRIDVFGDPPPSFPLMRAIKQQFDPNGILSPGRFVGRL